MNHAGEGAMVWMSYMPRPQPSHTHSQGMPTAKCQPMLLPLQGMLDFDHVCSRSLPSVAAMVYPFR